MKKLLVLLALCMVLAVMFVACNNEPEPPVEETTAGSTEAPTTEGTTEAPTTETQDSTTEETTEAPTTETQAPTTETTTEEETTTEAPDPAEPTWFMDAAGLAEKAATGNMLTAELNADEGYVRLTATGGDPYFQFLNAAGVQPQYMAIVYRTNTTKQGQIFIGSGAGPNAQGDNPLFSWNGNEQWNILVLDLANMEGLTAITDGNVNYARLDFFTDEGAEGDYLDLKYIGFYNTAKYATDAFFANIATIVPAADMASSIPGSPGINGATLSADGTFVTIDAIGQGDPYYQLPMLNQKGITGKFVAIKYRTTSTSYTTSEMFVGSGAGPNGQGDNIRFELTCDGKWQLAIVDLSAASAVVDNVINYLRWDPFAGSSDATIDMAYIGVFASEADALAYDATVAGLYVDTLNVPTTDWTVTGHKTGIQDSSDGMVAAGGVEFGALLHQGYISLGEINLAEMSKVVIYFGIDGSQVTIDRYDANPANRIILTSADQAMTMSPTEDVVLAANTYSELGWAVHAIEIDLTGVDYNGPVYVTYDTLPGTFMLISSVEFTYDPNYVEPEAPVEVPEHYDQVVVLGERDPAGAPYMGAGDKKMGQKLPLGETILKQITIKDLATYSDGNTNTWSFKVWAWNTDYATTVAGTPLYEITGENHNDNATFVLDIPVELMITGDVYYELEYLSGSGGFTGWPAKEVLVEGVESYVAGNLKAGTYASSVVVGVIGEAPAPSIIDKASAGLVGESCDTILVNNNLYFETDGQAYAKLAAVDNKITIKSGDVLGFRGWIGFNNVIESFGLQINGAEHTWGEFKQDTEAGVLAAGGANASRYLVTLPTEGAEAGEYTVSWAVKLDNGNIVNLYTVTVIVEAAA